MTRPFCGRFVSVIVPFQIGQLSLASSCPDLDIELCTMEMRYHLHIPTRETNQGESHDTRPSDLDDGKEEPKSGRSKMRDAGSIAEVAASYPLLTGLPFVDEASELDVEPRGGRMAFAIEPLGAEDSI
jgi:hypothetical protein